MKIREEMIIKKRKRIKEREEDNQILKGEKEISNEENEKRR